MNKFFASVIILLFGIYNLILYKNNLLGLYVHPRFFSTSLVASILATVVGVVGTVWALKDFRANKTGKVSIGLIGIILTLSVAFLIPARALSSATASQRSVDFNSLNLSPDFNITSNFNSDTKNYSVGDWVNSMNINPDYDYYNGKDVNVIGFVYTPLNYPEKYFLISRFAITCCAVDARPIGLKVKYEIDSKFKQDDWVKVAGKFAVEVNANQKELVIIPSTIESTQQPSNPYIF